MSREVDSGRVGSDIKIHVLLSRGQLIELLSRSSEIFLESKVVIIS